MLHLPTVRGLAPAHRSPPPFGMGGLEVLRLAACALCGAGWILAVARGPGPGPGAGRGALGGIAAFALALAGYAALEGAGRAVTWEIVLAGGLPALGAAAAIGVVEETAKLIGLGLATRGEGALPLARATVAGAASFAALEAALSLRGMPPAVLLARIVLAPAAHAALSAPLAMGLWAARARGRWTPAALGLAAACACHGLSDLALAAPVLPRVSHGAALLGPALAGAWWWRRIARASPAPARAAASPGPARLARLLRRTSSHLPPPAATRPA